MTGGAVANPLDKYAYISGGQQSIYREYVIPVGDTGPGFRIGGTVSAMPEPSSFALAALAVCAALLASHRHAFG